MAGLRQDQVALYTKDMYKAEREGYEQIPTVYDKIFKIVSGVKGAGDKSTQILGAGALVRHTVEGQDVKFKTPVQGWEYLVKYHTYSDGIALTKEAVEDTVKLGNLLKDLANTWGISVRVEKESMAARVFNEGGTLSGDWVFNGTHTNNTDSSGDLMYDSIPFFALSGNEYTHKGGGTYYNSVAGLAVSPGDFETVYVLHTATNNRSELDRPMKNKVDTLLTQVGADALMAKRILLTTAGLPGTEIHDKNIYAGMADPMDWDYLTDTGAFYVGKRQSMDMQWHDRQKALIDFFEDKTNKGYKASFLERYGILLKGRPWTRGGGASAA